jgi:hypothetical protein
MFSLAGFEGTIVLYRRTVGFFSDGATGSLPLQEARKRTRTSGLSAAKQVWTVRLIGEFSQ